MVKAQANIIKKGKGEVTITASFTRPADVYKNKDRFFISDHCSILID